MRRLTHPVNIATALALSVALVAYIALNSPIFQTYVRVAPDASPALAGNTPPLETPVAPVPQPIANSAEQRGMAVGGSLAAIPTRWASHARSKSTQQAGQASVLRSTRRTTFCF